MFISLFGCCANFFFIFFLYIVFTSVSTSYLLVLPRDKWSYHNLTLKHQFILTRALSFFLLKTKTSLLTISTVDRLKDLNIGYHLPRRHRSSRGVKRKKQNVQPFIVASFNAQSVKGNDVACKRCEISTFIKDNCVDLFFVTETWLSAQGDEAKTVELAQSGFDMK